MCKRRTRGYEELDSTDPPPGILSAPHSCAPRRALLQVGLFPIELVAYAQGVITHASGVVPNSVLHVVLAGGFAYFAARIRPGAASATASG